MATPTSTRWTCAVAAQRPPRPTRRPSTPRRAISRRRLADRLQLRPRRQPAALCRGARAAAANGASASARAATPRRYGHRAATSSPSPRSATGGFGIGIMRPDGSGERMLATGFLVEGPTWAPNGRVLMYFRTAERGRSRRCGLAAQGRHHRPLRASRYQRPPRLRIRPGHP